MELTSGPGTPVAPVIHAIRTSLGAALADLSVVRDDALSSPWRWRPGDPGEATLRYGFYRAHERLEEAAAAIVRGRAGLEGDAGDARGVGGSRGAGGARGAGGPGGAGGSFGPAVPILAVASAARWELHGALAGLPDAVLDQDPGGGEWTVRQTLGHIVSTQRYFGWTTAWWLRRGNAPGPLPETAGDASMPELPDEAAEALGSPAEILERVDGLVDLGGERFANLDAAALAVPARWRGTVDVAFRLGRSGGHMREHTIQIDKTLAYVGRTPSEVERLSRLIWTTYGRLEQLVFARTADALAAPFRDGRNAAAELESASADIVDLGQRVRAAAETVR